MTHEHHHGVDTGRGRLAAAFFITLTVFIAGVIGAWLTGSLALLVDAAHMLTDAGGLLVAFIAATLMQRPATDRLTWGYLRAEVLAAGVQATILLGVGIFALIEGIRRLYAPPEVHSTGLLIFGIVGLLGNVIALAVLAGGRNNSLNMRAAFLEVINDALGSVAVIVSAIVLATTGWDRADSVAGMVIALLIIPRAAVILRRAGSVLLEAVPEGLELSHVREHLMQVPHVESIHDLHASHIDTGTPVVSAHVVVAEERFQDGSVPEILRGVQQCLAEHFDLPIHHSTIQVEPPGHQETETHIHD